jgi:hypothetical protein
MLAGYRYTFEFETNQPQPILHAILPALSQTVRIRLANEDPVGIFTPLSMSESYSQASTITLAINALFLNFSVLSE